MTYVYTIRSDGSRVRRLDEGEAPAWSPDGRSIAYTSGGDLWVMNGDGTHPRRILESSRLRTVLGAPLGYGIAAPVWSPDGKRLIR